MYRINTLTRNVLITTDEVVVKGAMDQNVDIRYITASIETAEERFIAPALGDKFYEDFINAKNVVVTDDNHDALVADINASLAAYGKNPISGAQLVNGAIVNAIELCNANYQLLWNRYLWKLTAECVDLLATVPSWLRNSAGGQQYNNPKVLTSEQIGSASGDVKDVQFKLDHMAQSRIYPIISRMKKWIYESNNYPLFDTREFDKKGKTAMNGTGIVMGIYQENNVNGRNLWEWPYDENYGEERRRY